MHALALPLALATALLLTSLHARAQTLNRDLPVNIDADKVIVDDRNKIHVFEGSVVLTQGALTLKGDKLVITQNAAGFHNGVITANAGRLASFRQKRANDAGWVEGEAERIEYNSQSERAKLFNRAQVQSGGDKVRGQYIEYDTVSENYLVTDVPSRGNSTPTKERVHVTLQPKGSKSTADGQAGTATTGPR
ncbi:MAG: lipopolysaccharide transport periplasmic protein LptA [Azoarcus sp.]|jgi:lipopolysaccharide export system protein LptA|nr:lipopolysaccharide transport periplasmic protein LptA [Azoarcus sp.]